MLQPLEVPRWLAAPASPGGARSDPVGVLLTMAKCPGGTADRAITWWATRSGGLAPGMGDRGQE